MRYIFLIIVFLFTSFSFGKEYTAQTSAPVYQPMMENNKPSTNYLSAGMSNERNDFDHAKETSNISPNSKPKPKRYTLAKVVFYLLLATYCSYWLSINQ